MKVKVIKRYSDVATRKVQEVDDVLEVNENRAKHLVKEGVAVLLEEKPEKIPKA